MTRTYGTLDLDPVTGDWVVHKLESHAAIMLKRMFERVHKTDLDPIRITAGRGVAVDLEWFMQRYPLEMSRSVRVRLGKQARSYRKLQGELGRILLPDYVPPSFVGLQPEQEVRPYQARAVDVLSRRSSLLLGDDLGLGKTYTALAGCLDRSRLPAIVVVQPHLVDQWRDKLEAFTSLRCATLPSHRPSVDISNGGQKLPAADVYIVKYGQLTGWLSVLRDLKPQFIVWDEIQELRRGTESEKGKASKALADITPFRLGLSATPIYNFGGEIFSILSFIDGSILGSYDEFVREWCVPNDSKRLKDPDALGSYLRDQFVFLRRLRADVGRERPPVNKIVHYVPACGKAVASVEAMARQLAMRALSGSFVDRGQAARELDMLLRQATGIGKAHSVAAYVSVLLEAGRPVILAGWHREVYRIWLEELKDHKPLMFTGSESPTQKDASKRAFINGESNLLIMSLRSGAGVDDLQTRNPTVVIGELDWSHKVHDQLIGRADRGDGDNVVDAIFLLSNEGSDPPMVEYLGLKAHQARGVIDPGSPLEVSSRDDSAVRHLARRFLEMKGVSLPAETAPAQDGAPRDMAIAA